MKLYDQALIVRLRLMDIINSNNIPSMYSAAAKHLEYALARLSAILYMQSYLSTALFNSNQNLIMRVAHLVACTQICKVLLTHSKSDHLIS